MRCLCKGSSEVAQTQLFTREMQEASLQLNEAMCAERQAAGAGSGQTGTFSACPLLRTSVTKPKGSFHLSLCPRAKKDTFFRLFRDDAWKENVFKIPQGQPEVLGWIVSPKVPVPGEPLLVFAGDIT